MLMHVFYNESSTQSDTATLCLLDRSGVSRPFGELDDNGNLTRELEWEEEIAHELEMSRGELLTTLERLALKALEFDRQRIDNFKY